jgi:K+-sensing histidine kinase KdpD
LPAEDLLERLQAGKIYPKEGVEAALANFFAPKNLTRLRDMTLSETANILDRRNREGAELESNVGGITPPNWLRRIRGKITRKARRSEKVTKVLDE